MTFGNLVKFLFRSLERKYFETGLCRKVSNNDVEILSINSRIILKENCFHNSGQNPPAGCAML